MGSRARGNSTKRNTIQTDQTPHSHTGLPQRHSRPRGNDGVFLSGVGVMGQWVPAHAGIQRRETPSRLTRHLIPTQNYLNVIPAKAGIHNSRARGNSTKRNTIQTDQTSFPHRITSTSFPRRRESTIPAHAGIQRKETPSRLTRLHSHTGLPQRHSREGGNPQFPRTREFNEKKHHPD